MKPRRTLLSRQRPFYMDADYAVLVKTDISLLEKKLCLPQLGTKGNVHFVAVYNAELEGNRVKVRKARTGANPEA